MSGSSPSRPHAPELGRLARLLGPFHVSGVFWYRLHLWGVSVAPRWLVALCVWIFTTFFFLTLRRIRRALADNLAVALGPAGWLETERRVWRTLLSFAWCLTERYERLARPVVLRTVLEHGEAWERVCASERGFVLITGHLGNWEVGAALPEGHEGRRVHLVREEEIDPRAQEFIAGLLREHMAGFTTHFAAMEPLLGLRLREALERGEIVALQADRPRSGGRVVPVALFGRSYALPVGPFALARAASVPLLPVFVLRDGRFCYRIRFGDPLLVGDSAEGIAEAAACFATVLESTIRERPHQWFCFRRLW